MKKNIVYLSFLLFVSLVMARDLTKAPLEMPGAQVSTESKAKSLAGEKYVAKMNMRILSTEAVSELEIIKIGYTIKNFATAGDLLWQATVMTIDGAYRATIWVNPNTEEVYFVNGPWLENRCQSE